MRILLVAIVATVIALIVGGHNGATIVAVLAAGALIITGIRKAEH
jgi:hypothetical protein